MKSYGVRVLLLAAALVFASSAYAQKASAPTPKAPPPRVPFTAFRTKPILEPKLKLHLKNNTNSNSVVVEDVETPGQLPRVLIKLRPASKPQAAGQKDNAGQDDIIFSPQLAQPGNTATERQEPPQRITYAPGMPPVPPRKPNGPEGPADFVYVPPAPARVLTPPTAQEQEEAITLQPSSPAPDIADTQTVVIEPDSASTNENNDRFSSHQRMSGTAPKKPATTSARKLTSPGVPDDMKNIRLGSLEEGSGISPVLMPGQNIIMAAPDAAKSDKKGLPSEVVVFFQEASSDMEVGQMDVLDNDVIAALKQRSNLELDIVGYAEPQKGGPDATKKMALARALMIREYLVRQHISPDRLTVEGKADKTAIEPRDRVEMYFDR